MLGMFHYCIVFMAPEILVQFFFQTIINSSRIGKSCNKHGIIMDICSFFPPWPFLDDFLEISLEQHSVQIITFQSLVFTHHWREGRGRKEWQHQNIPFFNNQLFFFIFAFCSSFFTVPRRPEAARWSAPPGIPAPAASGARGPS